MNTVDFPDEYWMQQTLVLAEQGANVGEVPVGALIVQDNKIIGKGYNCPIIRNDPTAHAEIVAIRDAAKELNNYRLINTTLYVTLEPCPMCLGAILHSRIQRLVYAADDAKGGAVNSVVKLLDYKWNHKLTCTHGIMAEQSAAMLRDFFRRRRG